jgi:hypothetical protein
VVPALVVVSVLVVVPVLVVVLVRTPTTAAPADGSGVVVRVRSFRADA